MRRQALALALVAVAAGGLVAHAGPPLKPPTGALAVLAEGPGLAAMLDLEAKMSDSLREGYAVPVVFDSAEQLPGHVVSAPYWGDTQLWTGVYSGGQAMRYAVASRYLASRGLNHEERAFWTAQRDEALARVQTIVAAEHRDINIAVDWTSETRVPPQVNTDPTGRHLADVGGGVIQGEPGMVTRGCTPVGLGPLGINPPNHDPAKPIEDHSNHVYEITWHHGDGVRYYCETSPSRDTYAGLTFGLLTVFDLVGPDQPALRAQIRDDVFAMARFLVKYGWSYPRPNGYVAVQSDEDGFVSPLMAHVPIARLNIANAARHVAEVAGSDADRRTWSALWAEELASQGPLLGPSLDVNAFQPNEGYFKFNLDHLTGFNLLRTLSGPERDLVARGFAVMDKTTRDDVNAHFEAITFALTGDRARRDAAATHLQEWRAYRDATSQGQAVRNSTRCGAALACVPKDQAELAVDPAPGGAVTWYPGAGGSDLRAARPLPVAVRPPTDFLWQAPPTALDGQLSAAWREPGIDYLTPYWMLRWVTEVTPPAIAPLPEWVGPAHL